MKCCCCNGNGEIDSDDEKGKCEHCDGTGVEPGTNNEEV